MSTELKTDLSAPWYVYHTQVVKLFEQDPEVQVDGELAETETGYQFGIYSHNAEKIQAIKKLIGTKVVFGGVTVEITYGENQEEENVAETWRRAFTGNPLFCEVIETDMPFYGKFNYAIFKHEIIDFPSDDLGDYKGNSHYIIADLVKEVANSHNMFVCTES